MRVKLNLQPVFSIVICTILFLQGCSKSGSVNNDNKKTTIPVSSGIVYLLSDTYGAEATEIWTLSPSGKSNQISFNIPPGLIFDYNSNIEANVSPDNQTLQLAFQNGDESLTYFYKCNIDGTKVQQIPNAQGDIYAQTFINSSSILYMANLDNNKPIELRKINTDGTGDQKINITLPADEYFDEGQTVKVTGDGKTIIFSSDVYSATVNGSTIYKCNIDGSNLTPIIKTTDASTVSVAALANGSTILYERYGPSVNGLQLWAVNTDGSNNHQINFTLPAGFELEGYGYGILNNTLYFGAWDSSHNESVFSSNMDGSNVKLVMQVPEGCEVDLAGAIQ